MSVLQRLIGAEPVSVAGEWQWVGLAVLQAVRALNRDHSRKLTFGQIFMQLVRTQRTIPPVAQCVMTVDELVREGLLISERVLDEDHSFPYIQHIIIGLTEVGAACLIKAD